MIEYVKTEEAPQAIGPYSQAVIVNKMVYTSGQIALTPEGEMLQNSAAYQSEDVLKHDVQIQTEQVLRNLDAVLTAAGSSMGQVVKTTIYLDSMDDFALVNEIYAKAFGDHRPARSTVAVSTLPKNALVEIDAIATID
jgi:2-iminobutanoate/2-iminopropanoate deaminase